MTRLALIDADILVYETAHRCQKSVEWEPGEWTQHASMPEAQVDLASSIAFILKKTETDTGILALTDHTRADNFRRAVWPSYKAPRDEVSKHRPLLYSALREWMRENYDCRTKPGLEADDTIGILATGKINGLPPVENRVICSIDKDLDTIPGWHFNWRKAENGVYEIDPRRAYYNLLFQTLTGDATDNFPGCPKVGPKTAMQILLPIVNLDLDELKSFGWELVVQAYQRRGLTEEDALAQARCARILQAEDWDFEKNEVRLWMPPKGDRS